MRRLDFGAVSPLRLQALYHGLAEAMDDTTPDIVVFCSPAAPYLCVGYHQSAEDLPDLAFCRHAGWPVLRRKEGAVCLDQAQLFYQVIVHRAGAPFAVEQIYRAYLAAPVFDFPHARMARAWRVPSVPFRRNARRLTLGESCATAS